MKRLWLFLRLVWRPVHGEPGDSWLSALRQYRMDAMSAWRIAGMLSNG